MALRADIPVLLKESTDKQVRISLETVDKTAQEWLRIAMSLDSLKHERITFDHASGLTLEKVARGESVHRVRSLSELKRRLHEGRRCFGFFHPSMDADPLVFVHVALTNEISTSLSALDTGKEERSPTHAIFYSINSPHTALRGLDIASLLIKETAKALQASFPTLHTFSTLSPMPKFTKYLSKGEPTKCSKKMFEGLSAVCGQHYPDMFRGAQSNGELMKVLHKLLVDPSAAWVKNEKFCDDVAVKLQALGAHYIAREQTINRAEILPLDDVARFHLRNGAIFHRINWMANMSSQGIQDSAGMMVNYLYDFDKLEENAAKFGEATVIPMGKSVEALLSD
eukprot:gene38495-46791_t